MIQLKVFYNITFQQDWWKLIKADETVMSTLDDLMQIIRNKLQCLQFIPDEELQIQYKDNKDTFINLRLGDSFHNGLRCAQSCQVQQTVAGMNAPGSSECFPTNNEFSNKSPPYKRQRVNAWPDKSAINHQFFWLISVSVRSFNTREAGWGGERKQDSNRAPAGTGKTLSWLRKTSRYRVF